MLKSVGILLLLALSFHVYGNRQPGAKSMAFPYVVGSQRCSIKDNRYMISIWRKSEGEHICGGSLLLPTWVLTSGLCLKSYVKKPDKLMVTAGIECLYENFSSLPNTQSANISRIVFADKNDITNIAMVELKTPITEGKNISYIKLASMMSVMQENYLEKCKKSVILGWGVSLKKKNRILNNNSITDNLSKTRVPCLNCIFFSLALSKSCTNKVGIPVTNKTICSSESSQRYCQSDHGGPLVCKGVQVGVVKVGCAQGNYPGFYTRLDVFHKFISEVVKSHSGFCPYLDWNLTMIVLAIYLVGF